MKKVLTLVFDGFGMRDEEEGNAIKAADMSCFKTFWETYPHAILGASEESVGLMPGQMGNSEVGHMTIGAGRIIKSNMDRIAEFFKDPHGNEMYLDLIKDPSRRVHLMGLCSDGNIHASIEHMINMYHFLVADGFKKIYFHIITDGRDTPVNVCLKYINMIKEKIEIQGVGKIATVCGRYYAMDRDSNYERTKAYYDLVTKGKGTNVINLESSINNSYENDITDEFIKPILLEEEGIIKDGDALVWLNFRTDRAKQILNALVNPKFDGFETREYPNLDLYTIYEIDKSIKSKIFIGDVKVDNPLGLYFAKLGLKQARIAESEKYPHVTYFFDGGYNGKIENCDKFEIPSPEVETYDMQPEMSAIGVTKKVIDCMEKDYDFIFCNMANPDMVGHTGNMDAATKACIALDACLEKILEAAEDNFYTVILTADHGNADTMINPDGSICTTHSLAKVPFIIGDKKVELEKDGTLANIAPTILDYMDISIPIQMEEESLIKNS